MEIILKTFKHGPIDKLFILHLRHICKSGCFIYQSNFITFGNW
jgi:hypothetical protein